MNVNGCNNCIYGIYDTGTGFFNCKRENELTLKDLDDLMEKGGCNCSHFKIDNEEYKPANNYKPLSPDELKEILEDIYK